VAEESRNLRRKLTEFCEAICGGAEKKRSSFFDKKWGGGIEW
jgi:hypothetical protein